MCPGDELSSDRFDVFSDSVGAAADSVGPQCVIKRRRSGRVEQMRFSLVHRRGFLDLVTINLRLAASVGNLEASLVRVLVLR